jgi:hypothetical protein
MSASCEESSECEEIEVFGLSPVLLDSNFNELPRYGSTPTIAAILRLLGGGGSHGYEETIFAYPWFPLIISKPSLRDEAMLICGLL